VTGLVFRSFLALALLASANVPVRAEARTFRLDAQASKASFVVGSTLHKVHGTLFFDNGEFRFDTVTGVATGEIAVDATRTDTGNAKRDKKMHGKVLESSRYPAFVFELERVAGTVPEAGGASIELHGTMTLHGGSHPLAIPVTLEVDNGAVEARAEFPVPYVEWGLSDPSGFLLRVAKVVEVTLATEGAFTAAPAAAN